ncbi:hypothetical protein E2320_012212, partial [Naja naja]
MTPSCAMFYRSTSAMAPPSKNRFKRQSRIFSQVLYRTLSYKDRSSGPSLSEANKEDPSELSTQVSAPGVLKIFGCHICVGTHYKSVLATASSSAQELLKEALERYGLNRVDVSRYVLCDVVGTFAGSEKQWKMEGLRILRDHEKPLLIQDLWKPREGFSRRFELRKRSEVEEMMAEDKDTITAGINAQARKLQRNRTKGTMTLLMACHTSPPSLRRTVSETSLSQAGPPEEQKEEGPLRRHYSTLPETLRCMEGVPDGRAAAAPEEPNGGNTLRLSLYQSPHLLLLQGYSQQHDRLVYLLNCEQHTVGQRTQASKPSISLSAPDILPLHCSIRRVKLPTRSHHCTEEKLIIEPIPGASISINFSEVGKTVVLRHGDLISLGLSYLFLYKDPLKTQLLPTQTLVKLKAMRRAAEPKPPPAACKMCGTHFKDRASSSSSKKQEVQAFSSRKSNRRKLQLEFDKANEDLLLRRIMTLIEPTGDDHKLAPAFLLCLCIQHSATHFRLGDFGKLLLKATKMVQKSVWVSRFAVQGGNGRIDLLPDLQHIIFWMSNSIEILYFIQQKSPVYIQNMEEELDIKGSKESLFSLTITASEEAMTVLEEVIMYTFQQCVYYISKCNPFQSEGRDGWLSSPPLPEEIHKVVLIYQAALDLLHQYDVHPEVTSQMFAYLFFFSNTLLFNQLMEKGSSLGCFHWSKGVRIRATLRLLLEWAQSVGLGPLADQFFSKLSNDVLESFDNHPPIMLPTGGFKVDLETNHLDDNVYRHLLYIRHFLWSLRSKSPHSSDSLEAETPKSAFDWTNGRRTMTCEKPKMEENVSQVITTNLSISNYGAGETQLPNTLQQQQLERPKGKNGTKAITVSMDSSCLLTPPNTPLIFDSIGLELSPEITPGKDIPESHRNGLNGAKTPTQEGSSPTPYDFPTPASSNRSSATDDFCYVFVVELEKGPIGLGMGLIDGLHTPLSSPGIYIRTLIQDSPAAADGRLSIGDRILAVNGTSLVGSHYQSTKKPICDNDVSEVAFDREFWELYRNIEQLANLE